MAASYLRAFIEVRDASDPRIREPLRREMRELLGWFSAWPFGTPSNVRRRPRARTLCDFVSRPRPGRIPRVSAERRPCTLTHSLTTRHVPPRQGVTDLPDEFQRHFSGLLTLDVRVNELQKELDADMLAQLKHMAQSGPPPTKKQKKEAKGGEADTGDPVLAKRIEANMNEIIHISEEKMKRAQQIYDLVDQHIRKLDKDLRSFGAEVSKERERLGVTAAHYPANNSNKAADPAKKKKKDAAKAPEVLYKEALAVADAGEPKYCTCNRISFGEMIACESDECPVEWFHFSCVGLTEANRPKGAWLCPDCQRKGGKK